ncbi:MAG: copper homeostasis protein CutC [Bacteroidota bacterium]
MLLEICANSYQSAMNAATAGAERIELCSELAVGGVTPSYGLLTKVCKDLQIPIHVLIRPRSGDFTYSDVEFEIMKANIELCKELDCAGIVSGILHSDFTIDQKRTKELIALAKPLSFTFHRAFDWIPNPKEAVQVLAELGAARVLTSGQAPTAEEGTALLATLQEIAGNNLIIMPGGGINPENVVVFKKFGFQEIHCSATSLQQTINTPNISMNSQQMISDTHVAISNTEKIKQIRKGIHS